MLIFIGKAVDIDQLVEVAKHTKILEISDHYIDPMLKEAFKSVVEKPEEIKGEDCVAKYLELKRSQ